MHAVEGEVTQVGDVAQVRCTCGASGEVEWSDIAATRSARVAQWIIGHPSAGKRLPDVPRYPGEPEEELCCFEHMTTRGQRHAWACPKRNAG